MDSTPSSSPVPVSTPDKAPTPVRNSSSQTTERIEQFQEAGGGDKLLSWLPAKSPVSSPVSSPVTTLAAMPFTADATTAGCGLSATEENRDVLDLAAEGNTEIICEQPGDIGKMLSEIFASSVGVCDGVRLVHNQRTSSRTARLNKCDLEALWSHIVICSLNMKFEGLSEEAVVEHLMAEEILLSGLTFLHYKASQIDEFNQLVGYHHVKGDGFCFARASLQIQTIQEDMAAGIVQNMNHYKDIDWNLPSNKLQKHYEMYEQVVRYKEPLLQERHIAAIQSSKFMCKFLNTYKKNLISNWSDSANYMFLKTNFACFEHEPDVKPASVSGKMCFWGKLHRLPFHVFKQFYTEPPRLTVNQLKVVGAFSHNILFGGNHFFPVQNDTDGVDKIVLAYRDWMVKVVTKIFCVSEENCGALKSYCDAATAAATLIVAATSSGGATVGPASAPSDDGICDDKTRGDATVLAAENVSLGVLRGGQ